LFFFRVKNSNFKSMMVTESNIDEEIEIAWKERTNNLRKSYYIALSLLEEAETVGYQKGIAGACKVLGYCYWRFSDYASSLSFSLRAIEIYQKLKDKEGEADALNSVGAVYMFQKEHQKRLACNLECLRLRTEIKDLEGVASTQNNIGETYLEMGDLENAIKWLNIGLKNPHADPTNIAWLNYNLGRIYNIKKKVALALDYLYKALNISQQINYQVLVSESLLEIADIYLKDDYTNKALEAIEKALHTAEDIGAKEYIEKSYLLLSNIHEKKKNYKKALLFYKKYSKIHAELFNEKTEQQIKDIYYQYKINKVNRTIDIERLKSKELKKAYDKIELQKKVIELKNEEFVDSVTYARKIQRAFLQNPIIDNKKEYKTFLVFKPKDIVSGDFYWLGKYENYLYIVVGDCTGHGVPGAFLTMLGITHINEILSHNSTILPNKIIEILREKIINDIAQTESHRDGMDISIARINLTDLSVDWAGAKNPLWIIRKGSNKIEVITGDKQSVCYTEEPEPFTNHRMKLSKDDIIYLFTDGINDQFGGEKGKKLGRKRFKEILLKHKDKPMIEQKSHLVFEYENWKGSQEQVDDMCILGYKL